MGITTDIVIAFFSGILIGLAVSFIYKGIIISRYNMVIEPVDINSQLPVSDVPDHYGMNSRPPSYQSNEGGSTLSRDSAEAPPTYRSNERIDVEMIEMRPIPPSK